MPLVSEMIPGAGFSAGQVNALQGSNAAAVAAAGSGLADSTALTTRNSVVTSGSGGVSLPTWAAGGDDFYVFNNTGSSITVYPPIGSTAAINGGTASAGITVLTKKGAFLKVITNSSTGIIGAVY